MNIHIMNNSFRGQDPRAGGHHGRRHGRGRMIIVIIIIIIVIIVIISINLVIFSISMII